MSQILKPKKGYKKVKWLFGKTIEIPEEWEIKSIKELGNIVTGSTPNTSNKEYFDNDYLWASPTDFEKEKYVKQTSSMLSKKGIEISRKIPKNSVLVVCIGSTIGKIGMSFQKMATNQQINSIICNQYDPHFVYYQLQRNSFQIKTMANQVAVPILNKTEFGKLLIIIPKKINEQQKIAIILSNVDNIISNTQKIIDQTKSIKKGLMQQLLTKGIGHKKFKKVKWNYGKLLEIPETWNIVLLDTIAKRGSGHTPDIKNPEFYNGGIKWVSLADSNRLDNVFITETTKEISQKGIENSSAVKHPSGVVILSRDAGVGKSAITKTEMAVSQHFMVWQCGEHLNNYFLYYLLQFWKPFFESIAIGTTIPTIGLPFFKKFKIVFPQKIEQDKIASILSNIDSRIKSQIQYKEKLERLKKSLMQKLLTGQIRVTV